MKKDPINATYRCKRHTGFGVDDENQIVSGLTLEVIEGSYDLDLLADEIREAKAEASLLLPADGLKEGALYSARVTNICRERESGIIDGWEIEIYEVEDSHKSEQPGRARRRNDLPKML